MQEQKKSSSPSVPSTPASSSSRSCGPAAPARASREAARPPAPPDRELEAAPGTGTGTARRLPANAFADPFLEKLRLVVQLLEGEAESHTEAEAALAGPLTVERVATRGGSAAWAVVKRSEPIARGGRAAAVCGSRREALRLAAVLPAVPKLNPYHLSDAPKRLGWPLHVNRRHVGHVSRLSKVEDAKAAGKKAWSRRQVLLTHLHVARYLAASPEALAQVAESMGPEALAALGRALARRVEAIVDPPVA